jgi:hypothetical protein
MVSRDDLREVRGSLEAQDETGCQGLHVDVIAELGDSAAVAEVEDSPVDAGKDGGVDAADEAVGEGVGILVSVVVGAVEGWADEELDVGFDGDGWTVKSDAWTEEAAVEVRGEIGATVDGDG